MAKRTTPYGAFNYEVQVDFSEELLGGFSDVSGLSSEIKVAEYRNGNELENHTRKVGGIHTAGDVTCKRGIINSKKLFDWIKEARKKGPDAQKTMTVALLDENRQLVQKWVLRNVIPMKYTGATLAGKGGGDVAMEEIVFSAEAFEIEA